MEYDRVVNMLEYLKEHIERKKWCQRNIQKKIIIK
jgi:hypothetical protein